MKSEVWGRIVDSMTRLGDSPLYIDDNPVVTIMEIRARARRLASQVGKLSMVLVDYLQLMTSNRRREDNRQLEVAEISRGLKVLARELTARLWRCRSCRAIWRHGRTRGPCSPTCASRGQSNRTLTW